MSKAAARIYKPTHLFVYTVNEWKSDVILTKRFLKVIDVGNFYDVDGTENSECMGGRRRVRKDEEGLVMHSLKRRYIYFSERVDEEYAWHKLIESYNEEIGTLHFQIAQKQNVINQIYEEIGKNEE